jgi:HEPN domain-containing protein
MSDADRIGETLRWLRFAVEDLRSARHMTSDSIYPPRIECFFAQQAAEKAIKSALVYEQIHFPFVHDLEALRELLPDHWSLASAAIDLTPLSAWAVQARYPADLPEAVPSDASLAIEMANAVVEAVVSDLRDRGIAL